MENSRFMNFMLHFWVQYQKHKGISRVCAVFLNFFLFIFKLVFCGIILVIYAPHLAANTLLNKEGASLFERVLYVLMVVVSLAIDIPLLLVAVLCILMTVQFITGVQFLEAVLFGLISFGLIKLEVPLIKSLFRKGKIEEADEEHKTEYDVLDDEDT